jgi:predicted outer membrane repeat protein
LALVAACAMTGGSAVAQTIIRVDPQATGLNDGSTWCDARTDLPSTLASAQPNTEIWIARGTYTPGALQTDTFTMLSQVSLRGGFLGTQHPLGCANAEQVPDDRPTPIKGTILSGDIDGTPGASAGDIEHVVTFPGGVSSIILDGLTIRYGYADGAIQNGGGVLMDASFTSGIVFDEVKFRDNYAAGSGGGLYARIASFGMKFCVFRKNHSNLGTGGGMHIEQMGEVNIFSTLFVGNRSLVGGGGLAIVGTQDSQVGPLVYSCEFRGNNSHQGGGVYAFNTNRGGMFGNCTVVDNQAFELPGFPPAPGVGGGFFIDLNGTGAMSIYNSIVWDNESVVNGQAVTASSIGGPDASLAVVTYSDIEALAGNTWPGTGNILADPLFVSAATGDYNLQAGSPCADAAHDPNLVIAGLPGIPQDVMDLDEDGGAVTTITPFDLVKGTRREKNDPAAADSGVDGGARAGAIVDMGAHESQGQ